MYIESLELQDFRNYKNLHIDFDKGTNVFYGDNAQGKTNILESIYVCSTSKSHKSSRDREMIRFGCDESHIKMLVRKNDSSCRIDMHLKKNKSKGIAVNAVPVKKASDLFGIINVIFFSPEDLSIIKNGPSERRRFMDLELCQLNKLYVYDLVQYNKVLNQRNKLLKDMDHDPSLEDTLSSWDTQLIRFGKEIIGIRREFIAEVNDIIKEIHRDLSAGKEEIEVIYEPNVSEEDFESAIGKNRFQEERQKVTLTGPHRDDMSFVVNGTDIRKFGSQGQQRTAALSLKLAEIELVKRKVRDYPILLLDDVLSELDSSRQEALLAELDNIQTMITCTGLDEFVNSRFHMDRVFKIVNGTIESTM